MRIVSFSMLLAAILATANVQAANRYIYGDNAGNSTVTPVRPTLWAMNAAQPFKNISSDSSYQGSYSLQFAYDLAALDSTKTPPAPRNWSGINWVWGYPYSANITGATALRFAYKLSNVKHKLVINITCLDSLKKICKDTTCVDSIFAGRSTTNAAAAVGGVGTAGRAGWVVDSIPMSKWGDSLLLNAVNGVQFLVQYADTNDKSSTTGFFQIDEICFTNVVSSVRLPFAGHVPVFGNRVFKNNGIATITTYSMLGKVMGTVSVKVKAGEKSSAIIDNARQQANGACIVRISGAGVDAATMVLR